MYLTSKYNTTKATNVESMSAKAEESHTPFNPQNFGKMKSNGIKNISCRVRERKIAFCALPIAWKKFEATICIPTIGKANINNLNPVIERFIISSSFVKAEAISLGHNSATKNPMVVITNPAIIPFFSVDKTLCWSFAP